MKNSITSTYACLKCRKSFKKYRFNLLDDGSWEPIKYEVVCPHCSGEVFEAGSAFKAPKQKDIKAWERIEPLLKTGYKFNSGIGSPFEIRKAPKLSGRRGLSKSEFLKPARKRLKYGKNA